MGISYHQAVKLTELASLVNSSVRSGPLAPVSLTTVALAALEARGHLDSEHLWPRECRAFLRASIVLLERAVAVPWEALACVRAVAQILADLYVELRREAGHPSGAEGSPV